MKMRQLSLVLIQIQIWFQFSKVAMKFERHAKRAKLWLNSPMTNVLLHYNSVVDEDYTIVRVVFWGQQQICCNETSGITSVQKWKGKETHFQYEIQVALSSV